MHTHFSLGLGAGGAVNKRTVWVWNLPAMTPVANSVVCCTLPTLISDMPLFKYSKKSGHQLDSGALVPSLATAIATEPKVEKQAF